MNTPWQIIAELETDNSRLFKESIILREAVANNVEFFRGVRATIDPMLTFGVKKIEEKTAGTDGRGVNVENFWSMIEQLSARKLTGDAAQVAINYIRMTAKVDEWNGWYRRILIKDLRCGVSEKTVNKVVENDYPNYSIPIFGCQLAHDSANHDSKVIGQKLIEVKLDGVRVITVVYPDGRVDQYSRNGKELTNFTEIKKQLSKNAAFFAEPIVLDGEVMSSSFQDLMKQVHRKTDVQSDDAVLNLFDIITLKEFQAGIGAHRQIDRSYSLKMWYERLKEHMPNIAVVGQELVDLDTVQGQERFKMINTQAVAGGYEGIMIKDPIAVYECKRSVAWLKLKPFIEVSLEVTDVEEGTGRNVGRLGAFVCSGSDDGKQITVNVGSGFSDTDRVEFWNNRTNIVGKIVEIRADAVTQNQDGTYSLRFPRFLKFRGFENSEKL